jgi:hypothetical protein
MEEIAAEVLVRNLYVLPLLAQIGLAFREKCRGTTPATNPRGRTRMNLILLIVLLLLVVGALPTWPYSAGWGYYPSGGIGLILLLLVVLALTRAAP